jgi:hypothetical protein
MRNYRPSDRTPGQNGRWVSRDKEEVISQIVRGHITTAEAMERYSISEDELESWVSRLRRYGRVGLAATKIQIRPM